MISEERYIKLGQIYREHGVKGLCKFYCYSSRAENLRVGETYLLKKTDGEETEVTIIKTDRFKRYFLVHFNIFSKPESIVAYRKATLWIEKAKLKRDPSEVYDYEYIGCFVFNHHQKKIGVIKEVVYNPLKQFVVRLAKEFKKGKAKEVMIPFVADWVQSFDIKKKKLVMELPEGILQI